MATVTEQTKDKYYQELSEVANALASNFTKLLRHPGKVYGNVIDGGHLWSSEYTITVNPELSDREDATRLEPVDHYLAQNLLINLASEFPEFGQIRDWRQLIRENITLQLVETLHVVAHRRTFAGTCEVSRGWGKADPVDITAESEIDTMELVDKFLASKRAANLREATIKGYGATLRRFARRFTTLPRRPEDIEGYLEPHRGETATAWDIFIQIRLLYNFAEKRGLLPFPNPMSQLQTPKKVTKPPEHLSFEQARALLNAIIDDRERGLVYCFFGLGLRLSEARRLTQMDIGEDTIRTIYGKEREEPVPLAPPIRSALLKLAEGKRPDQPIFPGKKGPLSESRIQDIIKKLFERAGIKGVRSSPHTLRHSKGVLSSINGLDQFSSKRLLRHSSLEMTDHYNELNLEELKVKDRQYNPLLSLLGEAGEEEKPDYTQCQPDVEVLLLAQEPDTSAEYHADHDSEV